MELKDINLNKKDFFHFFFYRHKKNWSIISIPLLLIMVILALIARITSIGFDFVAACYLITFFVAILYVYTIIKVSKSYENKPFDLELDKGIYHIRRKNEKGKLVTTFKKDLKDFLYYDEDKNYYFLFPKKTTTFILPKLILNDENYRYLSAQLSKKVSKKKTPWLSKIINVILSISAIAYILFFIIGMTK